MSDVFHNLSMVMNVDQAEIAKIVHDYINRGIVSDYDRLNCPKPPIYIGPVKIETLKERLDNYKKHKYIKEETKMKATSVQNIKDVKDICFSIDNNPAEMESKFTIVASTNDDIFAFEFEGGDLLQCCKRAGLFTGWEKDQKIRELEKENKQNKESANIWSNEYYNLSKKFDKLQEENERLEQLKTPTIENFADEEPSSRRDILRCAEKCVCGQREQDYGTPESNFQLIADLWNGYLGNTLSKEKRDFEKELGVTHKHKELSVPWEISAMDVSMMMALLKIARIKNGGGSGDSFVDLAGYAACGGEIWAGQKHQKDQN